MPAKSSRVSKPAQVPQSWNASGIEEVEVPRHPSVFGAGLIALDLVANADSSSSFRAQAGGTCGNVLTALAYLGWNSYPIARLNDDAASRVVRADLTRWGVHLDHASAHQGPIRRLSFSR